MVRPEDLHEEQGQGVITLFDPAILGTYSFDDFKITSRELVEVGMCFSGQAEWFKGHGYDMRDFVKNGMMASKFLALNDALGNKAVKLVRERRLVQETEG